MNTLATGQQDNYTICPLHLLVNVYLSKLIHYISSVVDNKYNIKSKSGV